MTFTLPCILYLVCIWHAQSGEENEENTFAAQHLVKILSKHGVLPCCTSYAASNEENRHGYIKVSDEESGVVARKARNQ